MKINKQKILEILATAAISAGIAFLQSILANYTNSPNLQTNPEIAGIIGATIHGIRTIRI